MLNMLKYRLCMVGSSPQTLNTARCGPRTSVSIHMYVHIYVSRSSPELWEPMGPAEVVMPETGPSCSTPWEKSP